MDRSSSTRSQLTTQCPLDNLPSELLHIICAHLKPAEVANLRLASRVVTPIGMQYLVPKVHLVIAEDSFKSLAAVAEHPVVSKYVTSLSYEADTLEILNEEQWRRALTFFLPHHRKTEQQLKEAFRKYQELYEYQDRLHQLDEKIATAMTKLPNLKKLAFSAGFCRHKKGFRDAFQPGLCAEYRRDVEDWPVGLEQMRSLLLGACRAGLKIERLRCKEVNWRILSQEEETFEDMKRSVRHLRELIITFSTGLGGKEDEWGIHQVEKCAAYLRNGRLKELVTSAPDLERLEICFTWNEPVSPAKFEYVVGDFYWPSLKAVRFEMICATEDHLIRFFERHAGTINDLCIGDLKLLRGHWWSVLERMRPVLKLDHVEISGSLEGVSETETLNFDRNSKYEQVELREAIESYLRGDHTDQKQSFTDFLKSFWKDRPDVLFLWESTSHNH